MAQTATVAGILVLCCAGLLAQDASPRAPEPPSAKAATIRVSSDLINFGVIVTDKRGTIVPGLTADDFEITEDGIPQTIRTFAVGAEARPDLHVGLMFDQSESMLHDIELARTAGIRFLNLVPSAVDITLVEFAEHVSISHFSPDDFPWLVDRIRSSKVDGMTALYDAFTIYLTGAAGADGKSVLVAFTDGGNSRGRMRYSDLLAVAKASQATVYIVGLLEHQSGDYRGEAQLRLSRIAEETGGMAIFPFSMKQIDSAYDRIVAEIHGQYSLGYVSTDTRRDGRWHNVRVRVRRPDLKDVRVRTRAGYYAPSARQ
jgi:Ca-activated chloride channel family protein